MSFKRYSVFFALFLSLCFMSHPVNAEPVSDNLDDIICDRIYYADKYADLKRAFGYDHDKLLNHWRTYGISEGRSSSSIYDPQFYINKYGDLKKAFTRNGRVDWAALYNHFKQYGINEGRQASPHFNVSVYKNNYADLRNAFGGSNWRYLKHWREHGMAERRNATTSIGGNNSNNNNNNSSQKRQALQTVPAYTDSALSKRSGNERVDKGDWVTVLRETGNAYYVRYPVSNGTKDRWVSKSIFSSQPVNQGLRFPIKGAIVRSSKLKTAGYYCDYRAGEGTPLYAPANGRVEFRQSYSPKQGKLSSYGNSIRFTSSDGKYSVICAHLSSFNNVQTRISSSLKYPCGEKDYKDSTTISLGSRNVNQGDLLGYTGKTGNASDPHVHIEVRENNVPKDPAAVFQTW